MARRRNRRRKRSGIAVWLWTGGTLLLLVFLGLIASFVYVKLTIKNSELGADLCPSDGPTNRIVALIDISDPLPAVGRKQVLTKLSDLALSRKKSERIDIYIFGSRDSPVRLLFSGCNPGRGVDASQLTSNPKFIEKRFRNNFRTPVLSALTRIPQSTGNNSPIMSSLQKWAVDGLTKAADRKFPTRLIIISDMIENTKHYSQYKSGVDFKDFRDSAASTLFETDFHDTDVDIWYVRRLRTKLDEFQHVQFWSQWFKSNRAGKVTIQKIQIGSNE